MVAINDVPFDLQINILESHVPHVFWIEDSEVLKFSDLTCVMWCETRDLFPCFAKVEYKDTKMLGISLILRYKLITKDAVLEFGIFTVAIFFKEDTSSHHFSEVFCDLKSFAWKFSTSELTSDHTNQPTNQPSNGPDGWEILWIIKAGYVTTDPLTGLRLPPIKRTNGSATWWPQKMEYGSSLKTKDDISWSSKTFHCHMKCMTSWKNLEDGFFWFGGMASGHVWAVSCFGSVFISWKWAYNC